jgi:RNA polymerase sigma-70 factor (ECF subfamily)
VDRIATISSAASEQRGFTEIAHNVAITYSSRLRRRQPLSSTYPAMPQHASHEDPRRLVLLESIQQLEPIDRQLVLLYLEGFSARETEEVVGLAANNVAIRLTRLRRKLASAVQSKEVSQ